MFFDLLAVFFDFAFQLGRVDLAHQSFDDCWDLYDSLTSSSIERSRLNTTWPQSAMTAILFTEFGYFSAILHRTLFPFHLFFLGLRWNWAEPLMQIIKSANSPFSSWIRSTILWFQTWNCFCLFVFWGFFSKVPLWVLIFGTCLDLPLLIFPFFSNPKSPSSKFSSSNSSIAWLAFNFEFAPSERVCSSEKSVELLTERGLHARYLTHFLPTFI